jgi:hypothetical protein
MTGDHSALWHTTSRLLNKVEALEARVKALEAQTPSARQAQYEADVAMADLRASGWSEEEDY